MFVLGSILMWISIIFKFNLQDNDTTGNAIFLIMAIASIALIFGSFIYNHGSIRLSEKLTVTLFAKKNSDIASSSGYVPHCPTCGSTNVEKISGASKVGKAIAFGVLAAGSISKTFHCKNCGYRW